MNKATQCCPYFSFLFFFFFVLLHFVSQSSHLRFKDLNAKDQRGYTCLAIISTQDNPQEKTIIIDLVFQIVEVLIGRKFWKLFLCHDLTIDIIFSFMLIA